MAGQRSPESNPLEHADRLMAHLIDGNRVIVLIVKIIVCICTAIFLGDCENNQSMISFSCKKRCTFLRTMYEMYKNVESYMWE